MGHRWLHGRRGARRGRGVTVAGIAVVLGCASYYFGGKLPIFPQISASAFRIEATGYPVRIALGAPRPAPPTLRVTTSDDHAPKKVNEPESVKISQSTSNATMQLPIGEGLRENAAAAAQHPGWDAPLGAGGSARLLRLNFSISAGVQEDAINIKKRIDINNLDKGMISIKISGNSNIFVSAKDLIQISDGKLSDDALAALQNSEYVDINELRSLGFVIRYDAIRDRMLLSSGST